MKSSLHLLILLLAMTGFLSACGDLAKDDVVKRKLESDRFNVNCELKIDRLTKILEENVEDQIDCLDKSLDLFMRVVESDRPGNVSRRELEEYVTRYVPDFKPENLKVVKAVFDVNHLVFGDDPNYISPKSVRKIIDFLYIFNREMIKVYSFFASEEDISYTMHDVQRTRVFKAADTIGSELLKIFNRNRGDATHVLKIYDFLESFRTENNADGLETAKSVLFIKRALIGGDPKVLTHMEVRALLDKFAELASVAYDLVRLSHIDMDQVSLLDFLGGNIDRLERLLHFPASSPEIIFTMDEVLTALPNFVDDTFPDLLPYRDLVLQLKMTAMSNQVYSPTEDLRGQENVRPGELKVLIDHARDIVRRGAIYHRIYQHPKFKPYLESTRPVTINFNDYLLQFPTHEKYVKDFARIASGYRYFRGSFETAYYAHFYRRNADAFVEIGMWEHLIGLVMRRYGVPLDGGQYGMELEHFDALVMMFKPFLNAEEIVFEGRELKTSENITLLSSLFQNQSNGDDYVQPTELTEFLLGLLTADKVGKKVLEGLRENCSVDDRNRVTDIGCFRDNFFEVLCRKYRPYYPRLFDYLGITACDGLGNEADNRVFLETVEVVGRTCTVFNDNSDVPIDTGDMMSMFMVLYNIESTLTRFDINGNNVMDSNEVKNAFNEVYRGAIEGLVAKKADIIKKLPAGIQKFIAKKVFYFLIKYEKQPTTLGDFLKAAVTGAKPAKRKTVASILKVIGETGVPSTFDCELLR